MGFLRLYTAMMNLPEKGGSAWYDLTPSSSIHMSPNYQKGFFKGEQKGSIAPSWVLSNHEIDDLRAAAPT